MLSINPKGAELEDSTEEPSPHARLHIIGIPIVWLYFEVELVVVQLPSLIPHTHPCIPPLLPQ